jgi:addiction module HigA family antidote
MSNSSTTTERTSIAREDLHRLPIGDDADPQRLLPTHPGRVLREDFLIPLGLSARRLAAALHVPANRITAILNGERTVTAETALRLARYFGGDAEWWLRLQAAHDREVAEDALREELAAIVPRAEEKQVANRH